jgi:hypothetical protein
MHGCNWLFQSFDALFAASHALLPQSESRAAGSRPNRARFALFCRRIYRPDKAALKRECGSPIGPAERRSIA